MKQIKTIVKVMDPRVKASVMAQEFDDAVNEALRDGWVLVKRDAWMPCVTTDYDYHRTLYAELEREKKCVNCKNIGTEACQECNDTMDKWERGHGVQVVPAHLAKARGAKR